MPRSRDETRKPQCREPRPSAEGNTRPIMPGSETGEPRQDGSGVASGRGLGVHREWEGTYFAGWGFGLGHWGHRKCLRVPSWPQAFGTAEDTWSRPGRLLIRGEELPAKAKPPSPGIFSELQPYLCCSALSLLGSRVLGERAVRSQLESRQVPIWGGRFLLPAGVSSPGGPDKTGASQEQSKDLNAAAHPSGAQRKENGIERGCFRQKRGDPGTGCQLLGPAKPRQKLPPCHPFLDTPQHASAPLVKMQPTL